MVNALTPLIRCRLGKPPAYDEQIIALARAGVQPQPEIWFPADPEQKRAAVSGGF
jgi:predicted nucleic acid-binding Zn ribbon protein